MSQQYRLPCPSCDQEHRVDTTHVGLPFSCQCGQMLEVKTLRELRSLPRVEQPVANTGSEWDVRHGLWMLGTIVVFTGLVAMAVTWFRLPAPDEPQVVPEKFRRYTERMSLEETFELWDTLQKVPIEAPAFPEENNVSKFMQLRDQYKQQRFRWFLGWGILSSAGLCLILGGCFVPGSFKPEE